MRYVLSLLLFVVVNAALFAQDIPNSAYRVDITTPYADSALYVSALTFLDQEGFVIDKKDPVERTITTEYQRKGKGWVHVRLAVAIKDKLIKVQGYGMVNAYGHRLENEPLRMDGDALQRKGFRYVDDIARTLCRRLPGSMFEYVTRKP